MDKIFKNNAYNILELFIEHPTMHFFVRGIARELKINHSTVITYIKELEKKGFVKKDKTMIYPTYYANTEDAKYILYKKNYLIFKIEESKLINFIQKNTLPSSIILFGSGAKGTFSEKSDIDIFVESEKLDLELKKYEKFLGKKINIIFEPNINNLSNELKNNIINGIILYGFVKVDNHGWKNEF